MVCCLPYVVWFNRILIFCVCSLNILLAGSGNGQLAMYAYGVIHLGQLDLAKLGIENVSVTVNAVVARNKSFYDKGRC